MDGGSGLCGAGGFTGHDRGFGVAGDPASGVDENTWASSGLIWMWMDSPFMGGLRASTRSVVSLSPSLERDVCSVP